jgi:hypothetical protein
MSERKSVSVNVKSCSSRSVDSNDILPLATTTTAAWRTEATIHYMWWGGGYDMTSSPRYYSWFYSKSGEGRGEQEEEAEKGVTEEHQ